MVSNEGAEISQGDTKTSPEVAKPSPARENTSRFTPAFKAAIARARNALKLRNPQPEHSTSQKQEDFTPFPEGHRLESLNGIALLPIEGQKFVIEMLAYSRDFLSNYESAETPPVVKTELRGSLADHVAKTIEPKYSDQIDPNSKAVKYRQVFFNIIKPLNASQIDLGLKIIRPGHDFSSRSMKSLPGIGGLPPYEPNIQNIDRTKL